MKLRALEKETTMACGCVQRIKATSVAITGGAVTITVPSTVTFTRGQIYEIGLFTNIPTGTDGATIQITNGTDTEYVMNNAGNYFRPLPLRSRTILRVMYLADPAHFLLWGGH